MSRSWVFMGLFALVLAVPFVLRPKQRAVSEDHDTLVIVTPNNGALRTEFEHGFAKWYRQKTGRAVVVDWRAIGGTSEIARYLEGEYATSFQRHWTHDLQRPWSGEIQAGFFNARLATDAPAVVREAREEFLRSNASCGLDLFFGGGVYDFARQAQAGALVDAGMIASHPELFRDDVLPHEFAGEEYWDRRGRWFGVVLSGFGLLSNRDSFNRLGVPLPKQWADLENPKLLGALGLADPTRSSSMAVVFENILQQQMQRRLDELTRAQPTLSAEEREKIAVHDGWIDGMRIIQLLGANAGYFTDNSQRPPIDVAAGDFASGLCIDFYGRQQQEAVQRRGQSQRLVYVSPAGGSISSPDTIGLLRGAPHPELAKLFIEYVLSMDGQKLWAFKPGTPGGPERYALRRLSIRKDFYKHDEFKPFRSDPDDNPFDERDVLVYRTAWTGKWFREMAFAIRVMCSDTHDELVRAWQAVNAAGQPPEAMAVLQDMSAVDYDQLTGTIHRHLTAKDKTDEVKFARELGQRFRAQYARAEALAKTAKAEK